MPGRCPDTRRCVKRLLLICSTTHREPPSKTTKLTEHCMQGRRALPRQKNGVGILVVAALVSWKSAVYSRRCVSPTPALHCDLHTATWLAVGSSLFTPPVACGKRLEPRSGPGLGASESQPELPVRDRLSEKDTCEATPGRHHCARTVPHR